MPEPWLRGTLTDQPAVIRGVLHALEQAREDISEWCGALNDDEFNAPPSGLASVAFHVRHIAGSLDRLLTYAEDRQLSAAQLHTLAAETSPGAIRENVLHELAAAINQGSRRVRALASQDFESPRYVGRLKLPTTLGGLLVHIAEHTQRHVGQAVITAKVVWHNRIG